MSKADQLGNSAAFAAAARPRSARRQVIAQATGEAAPAGPVVRARLEELVGNPDNPRDTLGDVEEMAESFRARGQLQPVTVVTRADFLAVKPEHAAAVGDARYVVIYGNRRLAAAPLAGLDTLLIHVADSPASAGEILSGALVENIHRKNLEPLEEAKAVAELLEIHGSQAEVGRQLGMTRAWVSQRMALLGLRPELKEALRSGRLKVKEARRLGTLPEEEQLTAWEQIVNPVNRPPAPPASVPVVPVPKGPGVNPVNTPGESSSRQVVFQDAQRSAEPAGAGGVEASSSVVSMPGGGGFDVNPVDTARSSSASAVGHVVDAGVNPVNTAPAPAPAEAGNGGGLGADDRGDSGKGPKQLTLRLTLGEPQSLASQLKEQLEEDDLEELVTALMEMLPKR
ncbi:hypothetical protein GCM10027294_53130 [Marinactinospora endophytica]